MSPGTLKYFFSLVLLLEASFAFSQDSTREKAVDTVRNKYIPTGLRLGVDLVSLIKSRVTYKFTGWEASADVDFYRYYFTLDYGAWTRRDSIKSLQPGAANGYYENYGKYFRVGVDVNMLLKDPDKNMFFIGLRYGHSNFNESVSYAYLDSIYGKVNKSISASGLHGHWAEITCGLRVKIFSGLWMGYTARLKLAPGVGGTQGALMPYDMPGYGLVAKTSYWGFNYQIYWRIPFRKIR